MTLERARTQANVFDRSKRLFDDGYRAKVVDEMTVRVFNEHRVCYTVDPVNETCNCEYFVKREGADPCKHMLGWQEVVRRQFCELFPSTDVAFCPGQVLMTCGVQEAFEESGDWHGELLKRHLSKDWGELGDADKRSNDEALETGLRLLSAYVLSTGTRVWIITEASRTQTTFLLPGEY